MFVIGSGGICKRAALRPKQFSKMYNKLTDRYIGAANDLDDVFADIYEDKLYGVKKALKDRGHLEKLSPKDRSKVEGVIAKADARRKRVDDMESQMMRSLADYDEYGRW